MEEIIWKRAWEGLGKGKKCVELPLYMNRSVKKSFLGKGPKQKALFLWSFPVVELLQASMNAIPGAIFHKESYEGYFIVLHL